MCFAFLIPLLIAAVADPRATDPSRLSDVEIVQAYPALAIGSSILFLAGIACDLLLLYRCRNTRVLNLGKVTLKPWGARELGLLVSGYFMLNLVSMLVLAGLHRSFVLQDDIAWILILGCNLAISLGMLGGLYVYFYWRSWDWREIFGLSERSAVRGALDGLILYLAIIPPFVIIAVGFGLVCRLFNVESSPQPVVQILTSTDSPIVLGLVVLLAVVVAPLFEEIFFRGLLYPALKRRFGMGRALVGVSVAFAIVHLHLPSAGPLLALGLALVLAYELTGSLVTPILMHSLFNTANVLMLLYVRSQS